MQKSKIRTIVGLVLLYVAILLNWQWVWGVLFLLWALPDLFSGVTYFMEPVEKKSHPLLYWSIVLSWIWMSIYMILMSIFPQYNPQMYQPTKEVGIYQEIPLSTLKEAGTDRKLAERAFTSNPINYGQKKEQKLRSNDNSRDTLKYRTFIQNETRYYVGISIMLNTGDEKLESQIKELWEYFYKNDISEVISNIIDDRVYFIYSKVDGNGNYKATLAYRTKDIEEIYDGLDGIIIPSTKFAVFEHNQYDGYENISNTWNEIYASDLDTAEGFNLEVYEFDQKFNITKSEIRVAIK